MSAPFNLRGAPTNATITGTLSAGNTADVSFTTRCREIRIHNRSGATMYFLYGTTGTPSSTNWDFQVDSGDTLVLPEKVRQFRLGWSAGGPYTAGQHFRIHGWLDSAGD